MSHETIRETHGRAEGEPRAIKGLLYHRIIDDASASRAHWSCIPIEQFRRQVELLDRWGFTAITLQDYQLFQRGELDLPAKPVILTFDDGYLDTYRYAFPILRQFGMRAVVFVLGDRRIKTNYWDKNRGIPEAPLMEDAQILEMYQEGFEIGAHSMSHIDLTRLPEDKVWEEISRSRILLEILLNGAVQSFSYPYGTVNAITKRMVQHAGYTAACGVATGPAAFGRDSLEIRRLTITSSIGVTGFALRLLTPYQYYAWFKWAAKKLLSPVARDERDLNRLLAEKKRRHRHRRSSPIELTKEKAYEE